MAERDPYHSHTFEELCALPLVYHDELFADQVVLITGAAGGIGTAMSVLFGRLGATIVATGRTDESLSRLAADLATIDVACETVTMTVRDSDAVAATIDQAAAACGHIDHVINNAGGQFSADALDITPKGWAAVVETNLYGTWYMMQEAARRWIGDEQPGNIINISTIQGRASVGIPHTAAARAGGVALLAAVPTVDDQVTWAPTLDHALELTENSQLELADNSDEDHEENPLDLLGDLLDELDQVEYAAGEVVVEQGDESDGMFIVEEGVMTAFRIDARGKPHRLRRFGTGAMVGEIGLVTGGVRSAQVVAETQVLALWLSNARYQELREQSPELVFGLHEFIMRGQAARVVSLSEGLARSHS